MHALVALQKVNSLLCFLPGLPTGLGILMGLSGSDVVLRESVCSLLVPADRKSSMDVCFTVFLGTVRKVGSNSTGGVGATYPWSTVSSPDCLRCDAKC